MVVDRSVLLASVPDHDRPLVAAGCPGARCSGVPAADLADAETRILSITIHDAIDAATLARWPALQAIITRSAGFDHIDLAACKTRGVAVYHLGDYATQSVADWSITMLHALSRRLPEAWATTRRGSWQRGHLVGRLLSERTVGVLGTGAIGTSVATMLDAQGVRTVTCDVDPAAAPQGLLHSRVMALQDMLDACDALSIHVPLTPATTGLVDAAAMTRLGGDAIIVNTARGAVVDHDDLLHALAVGRLAGYAADVMPGEPAPPHLSALAAHDNVLLTPHLGAHNVATIRERYARTARIAEAVLSDEPERCADHLAIAMA